MEPCCLVRINLVRQYDVVFIFFKNPVGFRYCSISIASNDISGSLIVFFNCRNIICRWGQTKDVIGSRKLNRKYTRKRSNGTVMETETDGNGTKTTSQSTTRLILMRQQGITIKLYSIFMRTPAFLLYITGTSYAVVTCEFGSWAMRQQLRLP